MRRWLIAFLLLLIVVGVGAWPFMSAYTVAKAIQDRDVATLEQRVDWPRLRETLHASIIEDARAPAAAPEGKRPSLWQRFKAATKAATVPRVAGRMVESYVTPQGLIQLFSYQRTYRDSIRPWVGRPEPKGPLAGTFLADGRLDRALAVARRVERVAFPTWSRLEFVVQNRYDATRRYLTAFEREGLKWQLVEVRILPRTTGTSPPLSE